MAPAPVSPASVASQVMLRIVRKVAFSMTVVELLLFSMGVVLFNTNRTRGEGEGYPHSRRSFGERT